MSIKGQRHSLNLAKGHSDFKVKLLDFGLYTQVSDSGPHGPLVLINFADNFCPLPFLVLLGITGLPGIFGLSREDLWI